MNYIDVHCHLDGDCFKDISGVIERILRADVKKIIAAGYDLESSSLFRDYSERFSCVYFTAGLHPTELGGYCGDISRIEELALHPKCVAIGETGLDYHYPDTDKPLQRRAFVQQLVLANKLGLPVQIHSRDCAEDMLDILREHRELIKNGALMHCYSHSPETAERLSELGLCFSFGGASTWKGSKKAKKTIAALPSERLLTETDSPYMPPASKCGAFPNTPESIPEILSNMAEIRGVDCESMARVVWENAHRLFKKL